MKYLIDSLQSYEMDYGNALCPMQNEPKQSFMEDHVLMQPVTVNEFCMFTSALMSTLKMPPTNLNIPGLSIALPVSVSPILTPDTSSLTSPIQLNFSSPDHAPALVPLDNNPRLTNAAKSIPLAGVCIPDLPQHRGGWHIALRQWYDVDPKTG